MVECSCTMVKGERSPSEELLCAGACVFALTGKYGTDTVS